MFLGGTWNVYIVWPRNRSGMEDIGKDFKQTQEAHMQQDLCYHWYPNYYHYIQYKIGMLLTLIFV